MLQVVARFATGQDHTEALGSGGCCSGWGEGVPPFLSSGPSHHVHHGKVRGAPAQSGLWEALAPLKTLPREVWAETEGLEAAVLWAGQPEVSLFLLSHGSVR